MKNGYCEKDKNGKIHNCEKCFLKSVTQDDYVCNYFIPNSKNYVGSLKDVEGKKVRNELFFSIFGAVSIIIFIFLLLLSEMNKEFLVSPITYAIVLPIFSLSFLVALVERAVGKTVAKYTSDGIYTKQGFIKWQDIKSAEYSFYKYVWGGEMDHSFFTESSIKILSKDKSYFIFNPPILFLRTIKKNNKKISIGINKKDILKYLIIIGLAILAVLIAPSLI